MAKKYEFVPADAASAFYLKQGESYSFETSLYLDDATDTAFDPTGWTVEFSMAREDPVGSGTFVTEIDRETATIVDGPTGRVRFDASPVETDVPFGNHLVEWRVTQGGSVKYFPSQGYMRAVVQEALGS